MLDVPISRTEGCCILVGGCRFVGALTLEQQLHTVKANLLLREELHEQTLTHEGKLLSEAQEQQRRCIAEKNEDHDYLQNGRK
jgi:hypothetical protein